MTAAFPTTDMVSKDAPSGSPAKLSQAAWWPALAVGFVLCLQLHLAVTRSINWDEFHFLGQVHTFARGELALPMQTLHVRFFAWLVELDLTGVDQIRLARLFMLAAEAVTCGAIVLIARRFTTLPYALICALGYLSIGYVMHHGWSFRTDPIATALSMSSLAILARNRLSIVPLVSFALLMGTAFMITIKIVLFAPAFAGIAWLRWSEGNFSIERALRIAAGPMLAIIVAAMLFAWHSLSIAPASEAASLLDRSGEKMFTIGQLRNLGFFITAIALAIPFFLAAATLPFILLRNRDLSGAQKLASIGLFAMVATPFFYLNTFPYFYAFMLAPVAASLGAAFEAIGKRYGTALLTAVLAGWAFMVWVGETPSRLGEQRNIQIAASQMFAEPVHYFDFPGFLPQHRKANFFLTTYGLINYREGKKPKFTALMQEKPVPLLAAVDPQFNPSLLGVMEGLPQGIELFEDDAKALKETFRHIWGPLYVAGMQLDAGETSQWHVWVPGIYTADAAISVDGTSYAKGDYIDLKRGPVRITAPADSASGLLWGKDTQAPDLPEPQRPLWTDF